MKKLLSIIIALAMMLSLVACGGSEPSAPESSGGQPQQSEQQGGQPQAGQPETQPQDSTSLVSKVINLSAFGRDSENNPYKWTVLDVDTENSKALLLMDGYIDTMYMFTDDEIHTWENCQVREHLNFQPNMDVMFTAEEQKLILLTDVENPANPETGVSSGKDTKDKLFLLSVQEMEKYFENLEDRVIYDVDGNPVAQYLRTAGGQENYFAIIKPDNSGEIDYYGSYGYTEALAIRPAMWVDISGSAEEISQPQADQPETQPEPEKDDGGIDLAGFIGTKTGKFYSQFADGKMYMKYETVVEGMAMTVISAIKGDKVYSESIIDGVSSGTTIMDGEKMYIIDHASKMVITMALGENAMTIANTIVEEGDVDMGDLVKGTKEIDGKKYDTEEWIVDGVSNVMCFDGNDLKYIISEDSGMEMVIKVVEISNKVDDKLFEIPSGYTEFAM